MPFGSLRAALLEAEQFLLPSACLLCGGQNAPADGDALACGLCRSRWTAVPHPVCARCGEPRLDRDPACRLCASWPPALGRVRSAVWLRNGARQAVHLMKFEGWWRMADALAEAMRYLEPLTAEVLLVPIPLGTRRLRSRGYNQSAHLARALAGLTGARLAEDRLRRVRETGTQSALTPEGRVANVQGAFRARAVRGRQVVLVDDVFTTGSTLVAAAAALDASGASCIEAVTFARAEGPVPVPDPRS